jgi:hypothetical protein
VRAAQHFVTCSPIVHKGLLSAARCCYLQAWVAYLALDMLLSVVTCVETLADAVASTNGSTCSKQLQLAPVVTAAGELCSALLGYSLCFASQLNRG